MPLPKSTSSSKKNDIFIFIGLVVAILLILLLPFSGWIVSSYMEASAFSRVTGKNVSTWDAMFIELRVQESTE